MLTTNEKTELETLLSIENPSEWVVKRISDLQKKKEEPENKSEEPNDSLEIDEDTGINLKISKCILSIPDDTGFKEIVSIIDEYVGSRIKKFDFKDATINSMFQTLFNEVGSLSKLSEGNEHISDKLTKLVKEIAKISEKEEEALIEKYNENYKLQLLISLSALEQYQKTSNLLNTKVLGQEILVTSFYENLINTFQIMSKSDEESNWVLVKYILLNLIDMTYQQCELIRYLNTNLKEAKTSLKNDPVRKVSELLDILFK